MTRKADVLNDDDFTGNDDHIDALKEEVGDLRRLLEESKRQFAALRDREQDLRGRAISFQDSLQNLADAATLIEERWEHGDLADAVRSLMVDRDAARETLNAGKVWA